MFVIQTVPDVNNESSGPSYSVCGLCRGLYCCGVDVELHVPTVIEVGSNGFRVCSYSRKSFLQLRGMEWSPALKKGLIGCSQTTDVIHSNGLWMIPNLYAARAVRNTSCKLVTSPSWCTGRMESCAVLLRKEDNGTFAQSKALAVTDMFHSDDWKRLMNLFRTSAENGNIENWSAEYAANWLEAN